MSIRCLNCMKEYEESLKACPDCGFVPGTPPKEIYHLHPGVVLAKRYVIGTVVAYGGFGILYRAWDEKLQVMVAVKEYFPSSYVNRNPGEKDIFIYTSKKKSEFEAGLQTFLEEAKNTAKFSSHPNIVNVYDYFQENQTAYMVMEYMSGITLKEYVKKKGGKIGWEQAVDIITKICDDLQVVHENGILHRDISPDNIMMCGDGTIKLFDFGAAKFSNEEKEMTREIILKIGFAPPEQYRLRSRQGPWTDVYALGATLYRCITGVLPDESVNRQEALRVSKTDTLRPAKELAPEIPDYLNAAVSRAMAVQPELRFKDVLQLKEALLNKKTYADVEMELKKRKRRTRIGVAALTICLAAASVVCYGYYRTRRQETTLQGAGGVMWVPVDAGEEEDKEQMMETMLEEFREDYPDVTLDLVFIPREDYAGRLNQADESGGEFPTLYETGGEEEYSGTFPESRQADLSDVLKLVNTADYYCLEPEQLGGDVIRRLPLGMHLPAVYGNEVLMDSGQEPEEKNDRNAFFSGTSPFWIGDSRDYSQVQEALTGVYRMMPVEQETLTGGYDCMWSVDSRAARLDQAAAKRILYYFLGETAQDVLHLQYDNSLPLNRSEFAAYIEVNQEFSFLKEQLDSGILVVFPEESEYRKNLDQAYQSVVEDEKAVLKLTNWRNGGGS